MNNQLVEIIDVNITSDYVELTASAIEEALMAEDLFETYEIPQFIYISSPLQSLIPSYLLEKELKNFLEKQYPSHLTLLNDKVYLSGNSKEFPFLLLQKRPHLSMKPPLLSI